MKIKSLIKHNLMRAAMTLALILACATAWAQTTQSVTYIDENGQTQTVNATQIPSDHRLHSGTWYYVSGTVNCLDDVLYLMLENGTHNLILCDGAALTIKCIQQLSEKFAKLKVYGQSGGTGKLNVGKGTVTNAIYNCDFALYGGEVTLTYFSDWGYGTNKNVDFNGGKLTATSGANGIGGNTTINATSGWIKASKYGGSVTIAEGKYMKDETGRCYKGTLTDAEKAAVAGKTLQPATQTEYISYIFGGGNGSQNSPYLIGSTESWNYFCEALQDNNTYNHFSGKTVKLGANISIMQSAGSAGHEFMGTFDGDGKTLTVDITETTTQGTAPFREINGATIRNLVVTGSVEGTIHAAGLVGFARGADANTVNTITNCKVATNVTVTTPNSAGNYHCGGVVGHAFNCTLNMSNTVYCGNITSSGNNYVGGLQGWSDGNTINFSHCLFAGSYSGTASFHPVAVRNKDKTTTADVSHVYYTVTPTLTNSSFIAADGTKTISRATAPATIGNLTQSLNFMSTTIYQNGICYNNLYYATIGLPSGGTDIYLIDNADDWLYFCEMLNDNATWDRFIGKTVKLGANISVTQSAGSQNHDFCGTFDGQNNTLTFNHTAADNYCAPFRYVQGTGETNHAVIQNLNVVTNITAEDFRHTAGLIALQSGYVDVTDCNAVVNINCTKGTNNPNDLYPAGLVSQSNNTGSLTVSGCTVSGTIATDGKYAAGMVGIVQNSASITNSVSSVTINSSTNGDGTHGGFVASLVSDRQLTIEGCVFNGKIVTTNGLTTKCGGFLGHDNTEGGTGATITNCLYAPAADPNTVSTDCATFGRNVSSNLINNCYYTTALGNAQDAQGTHAYSITAGDYVTTLANAGTVSNNYTTSGLIFYNVGLKYGDVLYAAENDVVSLTLAHQDREGYDFIGYTATAGNLNGSTLTMLNEDVIINATFALIISYIGENGETLQCTNYTLLTGTETTLGVAGQETWYVADGTLNYGQTITISGNVHLILKDNAVMNVGTEETPINGRGIDGSDHFIRIYGQSTGDHIGTLSVYTARYNCNGIRTNNLTINGGHVIANTNGGSSNALYAYNGDVVINGGIVEATATDAVEHAHAIYATYNFTYTGGIVEANAASGYAINAGWGQQYTFTWRNPSDRITIGSTGLYNNSGNATATFTNAFTDGTNIYSGTLTGTEAISGLAGKTLYPYIEGSVPYIDENGQRQLCTEYNVLNGTETSLGTSGQETWYVVDSDVSFTDLTINGDIHLILVDGKTMNLNHEQGFVTLWGQANLTIYGQTNGTGTLSSLGTISTMNITVNGGIVNVKGTVFFKEENFIPAIWCLGDMVINGGKVYAQGDMGIVVASMGAKSDDMTTYNFTLNGGQVTAIGMSTDMGIIATGNITLGWTNPTDYIYANKYYAEGTLSIASSKTFVDENNTPYSGTIAQVDEAYAIDGKTLYPDCVVMKQVEGYEEGNGGWVFIASPVAGSIAPSEVHNLLGSYDEATGKYDYDLYRFNQSDPNGKEWQNWNATTTENHPDFTSLVNGQGYLYATKENRTLVFAGEYTAATGSVEVPLVYDEGKPLAGWNLVGNPFTAQATMTDGNGQPVSFYVINGQNVVPYEGSATIEPCTGVMVRAEGTGEKVRFTSVSPDQAPQPNKGSLQIALSQVPEPVEGPARNDNVYSGVGVSTSSTTLIDNAIISFNEGSKLGKFYFGTQNANIYIPQGQEEYAIAYSNGQGEMPLNFKAEENGTYTISVDVDNVEMGYLHLIDNMTGADVDLLAPNGGDTRPCVSTYTFTANTTDYESRFKLVFAVGSSTGSDTFAFFSNGNWIINNAGEATLQVIDVNGRILSSETVSGSVSKAIHAAPGVYMLRLINGDNVKVQKIVVR